MNMTTLIKEPLQRLSGSGIREFAQLAQKREGCISLTLGEPDFNTPDDIKGALKRALDSNLTHYAPNAGYDSLRKAIADYEHQKGVFYKSNEVIVTIGATEALFYALFAVIETGD